MLLFDAYIHYKKSKIYAPNFLRQSDMTYRSLRMKIFGCFVEELVWLKQFSNLSLKIVFYQSY